MKQSFFGLTILFFALTIMTTSCTKEEDPITVTIDSSQPNGTFTSDRSGSLTAENGTPTTGTVELGKDSDGTNFLHFGSNFTTELGTGTVSVYFSTSATFTADPANGNPDLQSAGAISKNGDQYFKLNGAVDSKFTHVILWCNTAGIPFGNAELK